MDPLTHIVGRVLFEVLCYGTGKAVVRLFFPNIGIEPYGRERSVSAWKLRGFTYLQGSRRILYWESVRLVGLGVWLLFGSLAVAVLR